MMIALRRWPDVSALESPGGWVRLVARRVAWRQHGRGASRRSLGLDPPMTSSDPVEGIDLAAAISRLPAREALAVRLHYAAGLPANDVARLLGCAESTVRVWLFRARAKLADTLSGIGGEWLTPDGWAVDDIVATAREAGYGSHVDRMLTELPARGCRWSLKFRSGRYEIATDDGERLDDGTYRLSCGRLLLVPWDHTGTVVAEATIDGFSGRFRVLTDDTAPTAGVPDDAYLAVLMEGDRFVRRDPFPDR